MSIQPHLKSPASMNSTNLKIVNFTFLALVFSFSCFTYNNAYGQDVVKADTSKPRTTRTKLKNYNEVITKDAVSDLGLFNIHKVDDKYYFEIPDSLLRRDFLWITRLAAVPANLSAGFLTAGTSINEQVIIWEKIDNKVLVRSKSTSSFAEDSLPINISVLANNYMPVIYSFDVAAYNQRNNSSVIDVTKFFLTDVKAISGITAGIRRDYKVSKLDEARSFINSIKSFPLNVEVRQDLTYDVSEPVDREQIGSISVLINQSIVLLPKVPMRPRLNDYRVGYFNLKRIDYGSEASKADEISYIRRWRLEPKDIEAYKRGELVEPIKPIIYYIDPATPVKLRPYIKAGVEAWQKVFETAGFKNAIIAKDPPTRDEDPFFNPEDVRYSVVRYVASTIRNAMGPSTIDPRSGEIIESDIFWYHNHLRSYRNRYLLETGAANPEARTLNTPLENLGDMVKYVITHEVGHALGLPHNMKASSAYPTDSLRSATFTQKNGLAPSIMDYTRYNYVAQPGDKNVRFTRQIGPYDHYSINWGYRYLPNTRSAQDEVATLSKWIEDKSGDPIYRFGGGDAFDPESQTENVGDDPIKASTYGLKNLKIVANNLYDWTAAETNNFEDLSELYGELIGVFGMYAGHVASNIGGIRYERLKPNQKGDIYIPISAKEQKASLDWLLKNVFSNVDWLNQSKIRKNIHHANHVESIRAIQVRFINSLLAPERLARLTENEIKNIDYTATDMISQLQNGIWNELFTGSKINIYRRNLQKGYLDRMAFLLTDQPTTQSQTIRPSQTPVNISQSDIRSIARANLQKLQQQIKTVRVKHQNDITRYHLDDAVARIERILEPEKK